MFRKSKKKKKNASNRENGTYINYRIDDYLLLQLYDAYFFETMIYFYMTMYYVLYQRREYYLVYFLIGVTFKITPFNLNLVYHLKKAPSI